MNIINLFNIIDSRFEGKEANLQIKVGYFKNTGEN